MCIRDSYYTGPDDENKNGRNVDGNGLKLVSILIELRSLLMEYLSTSNLRTRIQPAEQSLKRQIRFLTKNPNTHDIRSYTGGTSLLINMLFGNFMVGGTSWCSAQG